MLPAIERYTSSRIHAISELAKKRDCGFLILSGEYGLIKALSPIPWYDHLLIAVEVGNMVEKVTNQLIDSKVESLEFHYRNPRQYTSWQPYYDVIKESTKKSGVRLTLTMID